MPGERQAAKRPLCLLSGVEGQPAESSPQHRPAVWGGRFKEQRPWAVQGGCCVRCWHSGRASRLFSKARKHGLPDKNDTMSVVVNTDAQ